MKTLNMSQIQRELSLLNNFDIIKIVDRKKNITKGFFVDVKYSEEIKNIEKQHNKKLISNYCGLWKDKDIDLEQIRQKAWKK